MPASPNYQLHDYSFGSGGSNAPASPNYFLEGIAGQVEGVKQRGTTYELGAGLIFAQQANVPAAPTLQNSANYYNKLLFIVSPANNPSDAVFAIAISDDDFATTSYIQNDNTIGAALGAEDYQTYTNWGGASGEFVIGLLQGTTYKIKVKARHGRFTESGYGPVATAATVNPQFVFDIDVAATDVETDPPFNVDFGNLTAGSVASSPQRVWVDFDTNGETGGRVYVAAQNVGLRSSTLGYTISAVTGDLGALNEGFGAQGASATQQSGGPFSLLSPYNGAGNSVGIADTTIREMFSSGNPTGSGRGSFLLKAKSSVVTPSADDYTETLTVIASASF